MATTTSPFVKKQIAQSPFQPVVPTVPQKSLVDMALEAQDKRKQATQEAQDAMSLKNNMFSPTRADLPRRATIEEQAQIKAEPPKVMFPNTQFTSGAEKFAPNRLDLLKGKIYSPTLQQQIKDPKNDPVQAEKNRVANEILVNNREGAVEFVKTIDDKITQPELRSVRNLFKMGRTDMALEKLVEYSINENTRRGLSEGFKQYLATPAENVFKGLYQILTANPRGEYTKQFQDQQKLAEDSGVQQTVFGEKPSPESDISNAAIGRAKTTAAVIEFAVGAKYFAPEGMALGKAKDLENVAKSVMQENPYTYLGVRRGATQAEIDAAFRSKLPSGTTAALDTIQDQKLLSAYQILSNPESAANVENVLKMAENITKKGAQYKPYLQKFGAELSGIAKVNSAIEMKSQIESGSPSLEQGVKNIIEQTAIQVPFILILDILANPALLTTASKEAKDAFSKFQKAYNEMPKKKVGAMAITPEGAEILKYRNMGMTEEQAIAQVAKDKATKEVDLEKTSLVDMATGDVKYKVQPETIDTKITSPKEVKTISELNRKRIFEDEDGETQELTKKESKQIDDAMEKLGIHEVDFDESEGAELAISNPEKITKQEALKIWNDFMKEGGVPNLKTDKEGNILLYHGTDKESLSAIMKDGFEGYYFSPTAIENYGGSQSAKGYGDSIIEATIDPRYIHINGISEFKIDTDLKDKTILSIKEYKNEAPSFKTNLENTSQQDVSKESIKVLDDIKKRLKIEFPVKIADIILTGESEFPTAAGATHKGGIVLAKSSDVSVALHEVVHNVFRNIALIPEFKGFKKEDLLAEIEQTHGAEVTKIQEELGLSREAAAEELLADKLNDFINTGKTKEKGIIRRFLEAIWSALKGIGKSFENKGVQDFYAKIAKGKAKGRGTINLERKGFFSVLEKTGNYDVANFGKMTARFNIPKENSLTAEAKKYETANDFADSITDSSLGAIGRKYEGVPVINRPITDFNLGEQAIGKVNRTQKKTSQETVDQWVKKIQSGERPPVVVREGLSQSQEWIQDGHNRLAAYQQLGFKEVPTISKSQLTDIWNKAHETKFKLNDEQKLMEQIYQQETSGMPTEFQILENIDKELANQIESFTKESPLAIAKQLGFNKFGGNKQDAIDFIASKDADAFQKAGINLDEWISSEVQDQIGTDMVHETIVKMLEYKNQLSEDVAIEMKAIKDERVLTPLQEKQQELKDSIASRKRIIEESRKQNVEKKVLNKMESELYKEVKESALLQQRITKETAIEKAKQKSILREIAKQEKADAKKKSRIDSMKQAKGNVDGFDVNKYVAEQTAKQDAARESEKLTKKQKLSAFFKEVKQKLIDSSSPIEDVLRIAQKKGKYEVLPEFHITNQIDRVLRTPTLAGQFARDNGLEMVIKKVPNLEILDQYLIAKQSKTLIDKGIETGRDYVKDDLLIKNIPEIYKEYAKIVNDYSKKLLDYSVEAGLIDKELANSLKELYPDYVPMNRIFNELEKTEGFGSKAVASLSKQTIVQKIQGSSREVESPIRSLLEKTLSAFQQGEKNIAGRMLASYAKLPENPFQMKELQEGEKAKHTISFLDKGVKRTFEVPKPVEEAAKAMNVQSLNVLGKIFAFPVRVAKIGITGINLPFVASNIAKDQISGIINSQHALKTSIANPMVFMKALFNAVGHGKVYAEMGRSGALGTSFDIARNQVTETVGRARAGRNIGTKTVYTVRHPSELLRAVEDIIGRSEELTRIQQFEGTKQALMKKGMTEKRATILAARAARENTVNFARRGEWGQVLNSAFLYLNAGIQGSRTFVRNMKTHPTGTSLKLALVVFTPIAMATAWNLSDEKRKKAYEDIADYEKQNNIIIIPPDPVKNEDGSWNVIKIPLSQEVNNLAAIPRRAVEEAYGLDPVTAGDILKALSGAVSPINLDAGSIASTLTPQAIKPSIEAVVNKNLFTGIPTVPANLEKLSPELQVKPYTSGTVRKVGEALNLSPLKIEAWIKGTFGGVGSQYLNVSDRILANMDIIPKEQIGGQDTIKAILARFSLARGGNEDEKSNAILKTILQAQADDKFRIKQEAEILYSDLKKLTPEEANAKAMEIQEKNPVIFEALQKVVEKQKKGLDYNDRLIEQLPVETGERAKFIWEAVNELKTKEEKNAYIQDLQEKEIATANVINQLRKIKEGSPAVLGDEKTEKGLIDTVFTYAKAIGTDPITAFDRIFTGQTIRRIDNDAIIVERMPLTESTKIRREKGATKEMTLSHIIPLQLGGTNEKDNLILVPAQQDKDYMKTENYLAELLRSKEINRETAQTLITKFKKGEITEEELKIQATQ